MARDNLGETAALVAAGALLIDYVLTVAVSIAAGVAAMTSAFPEWHVNRVEVALGFMLVLMVGNLRGVRESGRIFAVPTYFFIVTVLTMIGRRRVARPDRRRDSGRSRESDGAVGRSAHALPAAHRVLQWLHGDDRCRGDVEWRARVQTA